MALVAEVLGGIQKGMLFQLVVGRTFGRIKADYLLKDENVSSTHCRVSSDEKGQLVLIDLDSANGLIVNSKVVKKILILHGVSFIIGNTALKIKELDDEAAENLPTNRSWRSQLRRYFSDNRPSSAPIPQHLKVFNPPIELEFLTGLQADQKAVFSYGPRAAGFGNLDLNIEDSEIPNLAFEIHPYTDSDSGGAILLNKSGFKVLLNKSPVARAELKEGDVIQAGKTTMKVSFI